MPLISVHLSVKDSASTLRRAVASTLASLPRDGELVVLDDASSDDVPGALRHIRDTRLRIERNDVSAGLGAARQRLLDMTDSRYVAIMDADDISLPRRFPVQLRALRAGADLVFSPVISFWEGENRVRPGLPAPITAEAMPLHLLVHNLLCNPTMAARREAVVSAGGYRTVPAEDHDLWLRALASGHRMVRTTRPLLMYRHHARQTSGDPQFVRQAFADPRLRQAYRTFTQRRFGIEPTWLDALWSAESRTEWMREELTPLVLLLDERSRRLDPLQRAVLSRTTRLLTMRLPGREPGNR